MTIIRLEILRSTAYIINHFSHSKMSSPSLQLNWYTFRVKSSCENKVRPELDIILRND